MQIFLDNDDYRRFVHILSDAVEEHDLVCWNYCLMPNHYHVTLQPTRANLSEAVRRVNGTYGQWWNKRHRRVGHVFQGRFKDQIVEGEGYLLALSKYVAMNPVRARLVERPEDWRWSSYRVTVGLDPDQSFLDWLSTLRLFGEDETGMLQKRFSQYMLEDPQEAMMDRFRSNERVLGTRIFKESVLTTTRGEAESCASGPALMGQMENGPGADRSRLSAGILIK